MSASETIEPPIRFPEFTEPWETKPIEGILKRHSTPVDVEAETEYTQIGMRSHGKGIFHKNAVTGKSLGNKRVFWIHPDCLVMNIIFAWEQAVGKTTEREAGLIASHRFPMYAPKDKQADIDFIVRFFLRPRGKHLLGLASPGGAGRNRTLGQKAFDKLKVVVPTLLEQRKIADFLTAVDGRIGQLIQKKALLEDYKKGVMQQLFTQAIRFKDDHGNDFPDWEEKKLGELFDITSSKRVFQSEWQDEGVPFYRAREIIKLGANGWVDNDLFISDEMFDEYEAKYGAPQKDDLLVTGVGTIGKVYRVPEGSKFYFKDGNIVWLKASDKIDSSFIQQLFKSRIVQKQITEGAAITTVATFTIVAAKNIKVPFPVRKEQTMIADFLSAIDRKIESVTTQITETQTFKRGLLQQMFV
ncbi:restriction endonuclease subunit S [Akkermansiaceae bacterium]|nr:restriction endonuclease subunit S [Akkermansiaceae bacterium]